MTYYVAIKNEKGIFELLDEDDDGKPTEMTQEYAESCVEHLIAQGNATNSVVVLFRPPVSISIKVKTPRLRFEEKEGEDKKDQALRQAQDEKQ